MHAPVSGGARPAPQLAGSRVPYAHLRRLLDLGTLAGVEILGGIANTRDLGPALGGLPGGPVVGVGAGLGVSSRIAFGAGTAKLERGDGLLLYTDGVTEAMDAAGGMFGAERPEVALSDVGAHDGAKRMMAAVRSAIDAFTAGAEQYNDITMVGFRQERGAS